MENASKALLIAGAILIAIILIGIAVAVITSTSNIQDQAGSTTDKMAIQTFNSQFLSYEGTGVSASQVTQLKSAIKANNAQDQAHTITINKNGQTEAGITVVSGAKYDVSFEYGDNGYINNAIIVKK